MSNLWGDHHSHITWQLPTKVSCWASLLDQTRKNIGPWHIAKFLKAWNGSYRALFTMMHGYLISEGNIWMAPNAFTSPFHLAIVMPPTSGDQSFKDSYMLCCVPYFESILGGDGIEPILNGKPRDQLKHLRLHSYAFSMSILNENERKKDKLIPNSWPHEIGVII